MIVTSVASSNHRSTSIHPSSVATDAAERDHETHRDQQHHAGLTVAYLGHPTTEEDETADNEHERAEERSHGTSTREVRRLVVQHPLGRVAKDDGRDRQGEAQPELPAEQLDVICVICVMLAVVV